MYIAPAGKVTPGIPKLGSRSVELAMADEADVILAY